MMYSLYFFEQNIVRYKLLYRLNYKNSHSLPSIKNIKVNMKIKEKNKGIEYKVIQGLDILELITKQRAKINKIEKARYNRSNFSTLIEVLLRNYNMYLFFSIVTFFILPTLERRYVVIKYVINSLGNFTLYIKDLSIFSSINRRYFNWSFPINVNITLTKRDPLVSSLFFNLFFNKPIAKNNNK